MPGRRKRLIREDDLYKIKQIKQVALCPDGRRVAYALQWADPKTHKLFTNLWMVDTDGRSAPRRLTRGKHHDHSPRFSPDGKWLAFLSDREDQLPLLFLLPLDGGEARPLCGEKGYFGPAAWSPDSKRIVCTFCEKDPADDSVRVKPNGEREVIYRRIERAFYKLDGVGFLPQNRRHIWVFGVAGGRGRQLTDGDFDHDNPVFAPDGRTVFFAANRNPDADFDPESLDLWRVDLRGGKPRKLRLPDGPKNLPACSPDGKWLAYVGHQHPGSAWDEHDAHVWVVPLRGGRPRSLSAKLKRTVESLTFNDLQGVSQTQPPLWTPDSKSVIFGLCRNGAGHLLRAEVHGRAVETLVGGECVAGEQALNQSATTMAYLRIDPLNPGDLYVGAPQAGAEKSHRRITRANDGLLNSLILSQPQEISFRARGGPTIQGWVVKPPRLRPRTRYPGILEIHGGPRAQRGYMFMHEFQLMAARGYAVLYANPRGSQGYGEKFAAPITNNWGTVDYLDCLAAAEALGRLPYVNARRLGVTGGSYGGYMTNWIITHTDRFRAAVSQRSVSNLYSMVGSSDLIEAIPRELAGKPPWKDTRNYLRQSPIQYAEGLKTPTLIMHSEQDLRCNMEQAEQMYAALKFKGVDCAFIRFPEESHGLSRSGRTDRRVARLKLILEWFDKYLK